MIKPDILKSWGPGGWPFYQPETNWHAPGPLENTFQAQVKNIIAMRVLNPRFGLAIDEPTVAAELEAYTEARWAKVYSKKGMLKFQAGPVELDKKKEPNFISGSKRVLSAVAGLVARADARSLEEWLGDRGKPVAAEEANRRAYLCVACKGNQKSGWREIMTVPAAKALRAYLTGKHQLNLSTPLDRDLGSCSACHCVLELKIWQPLDFIRDNTDLETTEKHRAANPNCWAIA